MAFATLFGAPGVLDDFAFWQQVVGEMNPTWANLLMGGGAVLISLSLLIFIERHWRFIYTNGKALTVFASALLMLALIGGGIYYLVFVHEFTKTIWVHPTLSIAGQERSKAECVMRAIEAEGSGSKIGSARLEFERACLISKGFVSKEVKR